jgi:hypothetical protein
MKATFKTVNATGISEIKEFLANNHKKGGDHFDVGMLSAWAKDAEFQLSEGNPASVEIRSFDSVSGHTETFTISDSGINCEEVEID